MHLHTKLLGIPLVILLSHGLLRAQETVLSSDELFQKARQEAFDHKNYPKAIALSKQALQKSPNYTDISIFLGRLYTWSDKVDSARMVFQDLALRNPTDADYYLAYGSLEYWEDQNDPALAIVDKGLLQAPKSEDLLLLRAKILKATKKYSEANQSLENLLKVNPQHTEGREQLLSIKDLIAGNEVGINYNFMHFDKQFEDPWHILSLSYKRSTPIGSVIFKTNLANKFASNGVQFELEAYPRLSKTFYMYLGTGYSNSDGLFPRFRTGASLYANLPLSFEAEAGFRQLKFSENIWMYTASIGKYYKSLWFNLRTYLTPGDDNISQSYALTTRYYTGGANDYLGLVVGTGISPEENRENLLSDSPYKLKTFKTGLDYNFSIKTKNMFSITATYYNLEFKPKTRDNQIDVSIGYRRRF